MITLKDNILATRVTHFVHKTVKMVAKGLGISVSEYLRTLILHDLESKGMFAGELKKAIEHSEPEKKPKESLLKALLRIDKEDDENTS